MKSFELSFAKISSFYLLKWLSYRTRPNSPDQNFLEANFRAYMGNVAKTLKHVSNEFV